MVKLSPKTPPKKPAPPVLKGELQIDPTAPSCVAVLHRLGERGEWFEQAVFEVRAADPDRVLALLNSAMTIQQSLSRKKG